MNLTEWLNNLALSNQPTSGALVTGALFAIMVLQLFLILNGIRTFKTHKARAILFLIVSSILTIIEFFSPPTAVIGTATAFVLIGELIYNRKALRR